MAEVVIKPLKDNFEKEKKKTQGKIKLTKPILFFAIPKMYLHVSQVSWWWDLLSRYLIQVCVNTQIKKIEEVYFDKHKHKFGFDFSLDLLFSFSIPTYFW